MWKQCHFLIRKKAFPAEFEVVARDLWTLRLQHAKDRVEDIGIGIGPDGESESQSQRDLFSSQSENESVSKKGTSFRKTSSSIHLIDNLAICYIAVLLLRLPVLAGDLYSWAQDGQLLFYSSLKAVPSEMKERLMGTYQDALEPHTLLSHDRLQNAISHLVSTYRQPIGMAIPPMNFPLLCLRCVKSLALPLNVYATISRLAVMVGYKFEFPGSRSRGENANVVNYPLAQLAALLVVAVKLLYPFDGITRLPFAHTEPAVTVVDWTVWMDQAKASKASAGSRLGYSQAIATEESDIMSMPKSHIDDYLDCYGDTWASEVISKYDKEADFKRGLLAMFPAKRTTPAPKSMTAAEADEDQTDHLEAVLRSLQIREPLPHGKQSKSREKVFRPGSYYKQWRKENDIESNARVFVEAVGSLVGISNHKLVRAVFATETRLQIWVREERKKEKAPTSA